MTGGDPEREFERGSIESASPPPKSEDRDELEDTRRELREARSQQDAVAKILKVIGSSVSELEPTLDAIAAAAQRLCEADGAVIFRRYGDEWGFAAGAGTGLTVVRERRKLETPPTSILARCVAGGTTIHSRDAGRDVIPNPDGHSLTRLAVPVSRSGEVMVVIGVGREAAGGFSDREVELVETFADQAAIAIENVRLFNETREALEQQTATAEILRAISESPTDVVPVLEAIARGATQFCGAEDAFLLLRDGDRVQARAHVGPIPVEIPSSIPLDRTSVPGRVILDGRSIEVGDAMNAADFPLGRELARNSGINRNFGTPLMRQGAAIGVLLLRRVEDQPFTERQRSFAETFAAQAVIAIENVRLFNETKEALERQTATSEVLKAISDSRFDLQPVFDQMISKAVQLCRADFGALYHHTREGEVSATVNIPSQLLVQNREAGRRIATEGPNRKLLGGRVRLEQATVHIPDITLDHELERRPGDAYDQLSVRAILGVPMHRAGEIQGILTLWKTEPGPFSQSAIALVEGFADQAVIAIENVRLFNETTEALERQTATGEVLKVISRSAFDLQRVLDTVVESARRLTNGSTGALWRLEGEEYRFAASSNPDEAVKETLRGLRIRPHEHGTVVARAALSGQPAQVEDVETDPLYASTPFRESSQTRTRLAVPLLREGVPIGVLLVGRQEVKLFTEKEIELVVSFADQAVIAIENTRLLNEIQDQSRQLEAASRHKSEFLANMSHELRTPLNAIIGFSDVLEQRMFGELNERQAEYTRDIATSGRHLLNLVNEILDLAKVEAGRMELELSAFAPAETIRGALGFVRERAAEHQITLEADLPEDLGILVADERKVRQVLLNLLSNAVKFTPDGGRVSLRAQQRDGELEIAVQDTGIGISRDDLPRVFEEFQQVGTTTDRSREGTGLGLTLAKRFIELHGGRIWVESEVGMGTTFTFAVPLDPATAPR